MRTPQELRALVKGAPYHIGAYGPWIRGLGRAVEQYADALERAQVGITEESVAAAVFCYERSIAVQFDAGDQMFDRAAAMRAALESVWPLQAKDAQAIHAAMVRDNDEIAMQGDLAEELLAARQTLERVRGVLAAWDDGDCESHTADVLHAELEAALKETSK